MGPQRSDNSGEDSVIDLNWLDFFNWQDFFRIPESPENWAEAGRGLCVKPRTCGFSGSVALKVLSGKLAADPEPWDRLQREARAASNHPNIRPIHDIGEQDGKPFLVMEYLHGTAATRSQQQK